MKKMSIILVIFMLFTLVPVDIAKADTESVPNPTLVVGYNAKKKRFTVQLNHANKNAKIYYKWDDENKYKEIKPGTTILINVDGAKYIRWWNLQVYTQVGKKKGKVKKYNMWKLIESQTNSRIKKEAMALVNEGDDSVCRFMKLIVWFQDQYRSGYIGEDEKGLNTFYIRIGNKSDLCYIFARYCEALGIKVQCMTYTDYLYRGEHDECVCHVYLDKYPILVDPYEMVYDIKNGWGEIYDRGSLEERSYNKSKYKFNFTKKTKCKYLDYESFLYDDIIYTDGKFTDDAIIRERDVLNMLLHKDGTTFCEPHRKIEKCKIENNLVEITYKLHEELVNNDYAYKKLELRYDQEDGYWYGRYWSADGKLLWDDKEKIKEFKVQFGNKKNKDWEEE